MIEPVLDKPIDRTIWLWNGDRWTFRRPYYRDIKYNPIPYAWHYMLFKNFALYRFLVGGVWHESYSDRGEWIRMQDWQKQEFCHDHTKMNPCPVCALN